VEYCLERAGCFCTLPLLELGGVKPPSKIIFFLSFSQSHSFQPGRDKNVMPLMKNFHEGGDHDTPLD
jgi:hypothetical protein